MEVLLKTRFFTYLTNNTSMAKNLKIFYLALDFDKTQINSIWTKINSKILEDAFKSNKSIQISQQMKILF